VNKVYKTAPDGYIKALDGIVRKTLVCGEKSLLTEFRMEKGSKLPQHKHPQEQVGYLVTGHIILYIDSEKYDIGPGDSWAILGEIEHSADILEDSIAIEIFSPIREDYLP
jgi:quercetin dioxygenase-like cupin family protein